MIEWKPTHRSVIDGSQARQVKGEGPPPSSGYIALDNEDGVTWLDLASRWKPITEPLYFEYTGRLVIAGSDKRIRSGDKVELVNFNASPAFAAVRRTRAETPDEHVYVLKTDLRPWQDMEVVQTDEPPSGPREDAIVWETISERNREIARAEDGDRRISVLEQQLREADAMRRSFDTRVLKSAYGLLGDGAGHGWDENPEYTKAICELVGELLPDRGFGFGFSESRDFILGMIYAAGEDA